MTRLSVAVKLVFWLRYSAPSRAKSPKNTNSTSKYPQGRLREIGKRGGSFRAGAGLLAPGLRDGELHASRKPLTDRGGGECWYYPFRYGGYLRTGGERAAVGRGVEIH